MNDDLRPDRPPFWIDCETSFPAAPVWTKDLVIYEINPYAFTSPDGAGDGGGSGDFDSLRQKMDYIQDLGVNGVWLAGFSRATNHFYNIKSVYACVRPDELDPDLGTPDEFKAMIQEAHRHGIKVFLDVVTHGVVNGSPLIEEHPDWFRGGTWGMTDYDYENVEFQQWWVDLWTRYALEFGVDGYRLDVPRHEQTHLWREIAARCETAGHPILIFPERVIAGHFGQRDYVGFSTDVAGEFCNTPRYMGGQISCHDEGWKCGPGAHYRLRGNRANLIYTLLGYNVPIFMAGEEFNAQQVSLPGLERNLFGGGGPGGWLYGSWIQWEQLKDPFHREMLDDFRTTLRIRHRNRDIIHNDRARTHILRIPHRPAMRPIPYVRFLPGEAAIIVIANSDDDPVTVRLTVPLTAMALDGHERYRVIDLWRNAPTVVSEADLCDYAVVTPGARTYQGGARVLRIEPVAKPQP